MIKYNSNTINDWYYDSSDLIKVYYNNAVCYYKVTSGDTPTPVQEPCYAVVDDITQYSDTEFEDVYDIETDKWYKLNNLNQYEAYGVYGSGRNITHYEGKLTIDGNYEYQYSGGSWVNVGELSGSSITIKSPEYIEKDSSHNGKINLDYVWKTNTKMQFKFYSTNNGGGSMIGEDGMPDNNDCRVFFASTSAYFDYGSSRITWSSNGQKNTLYEYEYGNYYIKNMVTSSIKTGTTFSTNRTNTLTLGYGSSDRFRTYYIKIYEGNTLVKDFIPWTDMNGNYGLYDKVSSSVYNVASGTLTGSSNVTDVEVGSGYTYPIYYDEIQDPPDNVPFASMSEAQEYECPWWGMTGIIANADYLFCDSNEWLTKYSYQEVSGYICDSGNKYKKLQEFERNVDGTMSSVGYVKGDLIEIASLDCPQCTVNFCGVAANGNDVIINNGTATLTQSNWTSPYPVKGEVGAATTTIGIYCFRNIRGTLTALTIGNTVTTIEHEAFMETSLLTTLTIPASVTQIDFWAFTRCDGLQEVIFEGTTPPTFTNQNSGVFHDYCPPVIYVPDSALSAYRAISDSVWTNQSFDVNTRIKGISERS